MADQPVTLPFLAAGSAVVAPTVVPTAIARVTQSVIELLGLTAPPPAVRMTQVVIEVCGGTFSPSTARVTHAVVEILSGSAVNIQAFPILTMAF